MFEPIKQLQEAARQALHQICPGLAAERIQILDCRDRVLVSLVIPTGPLVPPKTEEQPVLPGWEVTDRVARYDGKLVTIAPSRLRLLKTLVNAEAPIAAKNLVGTAFDSHTSEANVRFHVGELRKELNSAFPSFEGDPIETDNGYLLVLGK